MKKMTSLINRKLTLDVPVKITTQKKPGNQVEILARASYGMFNAVDGVTAKARCPMEEADKAAERAVGSSLEMLRDLIQMTAPELGLERGRPKRRRILDDMGFSNADRAEWALEVMKAYRLAHYSPTEPLDTVIGDFLCNLHHLVDRKKYIWNVLTAHGDFHYYGEVKEEGITPTREKKTRRAHGSR